MDDPDYMCAFDAEVSYRHCSQAVQWYSSTSFDDLFAVSFETSTFVLEPSTSIYRISFVENLCQIFIRNMVCYLWIRSSLPPISCIATE